jgi:hypothetical protein
MNPFDYKIASLVDIGQGTHLFDATATVSLLNVARN